MLTPLSALAYKQAAPTEATTEECLQFLDYVASQEDSIITYKAINMVLVIHSDASCLFKPKACSRASRHMFMAGKEGIPNINDNCTVLNILQIIRAVMSFTAEAKLGALFINANTAVSMHRTPEERGHPQTQTPIKTDNSTQPHTLYSSIKPFQRHLKPWI
jgi:hypothetical protein